MAAALSLGTLRRTQPCQDLGKECSWRGNSQVQSHEVRPGLAFQSQPSRKQMAQRGRSWDLMKRLFTKGQGEGKPAWDGEGLRGRRWWKPLPHTLPGLKGQEEAVPRPQRHTGRHVRSCGPQDRNTTHSLAGRELEEQMPQPCLPPAGASHWTESTRAPPEAGGKGVQGPSPSRCTSWGSEQGKEWTVN